MAFSIHWGPHCDGLFCLYSQAPCGGGCSHQGPICHQSEKHLAHLRCAGTAVTGQSCHCKILCSAAYTLLISRCSFSSNYLCATVTPKHLGALLSSNNYWYMWEKSRLIHSLLRELQEEHRKGVLSCTMHKAPMGASECRLTSRRVILQRQAVWFLGIGLCQVSKWESNAYKLSLCGLSYFCICFALLFIQRSLKPNGSSKLVLSQTFALAVRMWKWAGVVKMGPITPTCFECCITELFPVL